MELIGFLLCVVLGFVPMFILSGIMYSLDRYEKEPKVLLGGVFAWGAIVAVIGALVLQLALGATIYAITNSSVLEEITGSTLIAPITEELLKGMAVFLVYLIFRREFDSVLDGIIYASVVGLGFAATENVLYFFGAFLEGGIGGLFVLFFLRFIVFGWQHAFFTSFIGIGFAFSRLNRDPLIKIFAPLVGLGIAILAHATHNGVLTFLEDIGALAVATFVAWSGWVVMFIFIVWQIYSEKRWLAEHLRDEVSLGVITARQYHAACSMFGQTGARWAAIGSGRFGSTNRFFQLCGELAHKKRQLATVGDETGNAQIISSLRAELNRLSPSV